MTWYQSNFVYKTISRVFLDVRIVIVDIVIDRFGTVSCPWLSGTRRRTCCKIRLFAISDSTPPCSPPSPTRPSPRSSCWTRSRSTATTTWTSSRLSTRSCSCCTRVSAPSVTFPIHSINVDDCFFSWRFVRGCHLEVVQGIALLPRLVGFYGPDEKVHRLARKRRRRYLFVFFRF